VGERVKQNMKYSLVRKPGAGKPHAGFDERDVKTEHGEASEAPATERAGNRYAEPKITAPPLDSTVLSRDRVSEVNATQMTGCQTVSRNDWARFAPTF